MNTWVCPIDNGWYASLNPSGTRVVYGNGCVGVHDFVAGTTTDYTQSRPTYHGTWSDDDTFLLVIRHEAGTGYDLFWQNVTTAARESAGQIPDTNLCLCGPGRHWAAVCSGRLILDGTDIDAVTGWPFGITLDPRGRVAVAINCADGMRLYVDGLWKRTVPIPYNVSRFAFTWPIIDCGYAVPHRINVETGHDDAVGCFPQHGESYAAPTRDGLIWTLGIVDPQTYLCGRVLGASSGIVVPLAWGATVTARQTPTCYRVAVNKENGPLAVYDVPLDSPIVPIPQPPPPPVIPDPKGHVTFFPVNGPSPLTVTGQITLDADSGPTQQVRFFGQHGADAPVRWSGPTGNDLSALGILSATGTWTCWARMQGTNGMVVDLPAAPITVTAPPPVRYRGINAGFGDAIGQERLDDLIAANYTLIRSKIGATRAPGMTLLNLITMDNPASVILQLQQMDGTLAEAGNEPNIGCDAQPKLTPGQYVVLAELVRDYATVNGVTVYYGAISNCNPEGQAWLAEVLRLAPWVERVSVHRYQFGKGQPNPNASPYGSRMQEWAALSRVLNGRRMLVTETGCPDQHQEKFLFWWRTRPTSQQAQLDYIRAELRYWSTVPTCDGVVLYQEWTGTNPTSPDHYGLRGPDWTPTSAFYVFR